MMPLEIPSCPNQSYPGPAKTLISLVLLSRYSYASRSAQARNGTPPHAATQAPNTSPQLLPRLPLCYYSVLCTTWLLRYDFILCPFTHHLYPGAFLLLRLLFEQKTSGWLVFLARSFRPPPFALRGGDPIPCHSAHHSPFVY